MLDDYDVGVIQRRCRAPFLLEPADPVWIASECSGKDLQGNFTTQPRIACPVHLAHASRADRRKNLVGSQTRAGGYGHSGLNNRNLAQAVDDPQLPRRI
jgi:hypothetical protein